MASKAKQAAWPGFFLLFAVLCNILMLTAQGYGAQDGVTLVYQRILSWSVPAMFMVFGMGALSGGRGALKDSLLVLALPAFCALVVWGAVYAVAAHLLAGQAVSLGGVFAALKAAALGDTYFHLWVLYPLIGLYLVHPVLQRFVSGATRAEVIYILALCFLFASVLPVWGVFFKSGALVAFLERLQVHLVLGWVGCYLAGWYFRHYEISRISEFAIYVLGIVGLMMTTMGQTLFGGGSGQWHGYMTPWVILTAVAVCVLFRYVLGVSDERSRRQAVYRIGGAGFEIYFVHQLWVLVFRWLNIAHPPVPTALGIAMMGMIYFALSVPLGWLLAKIPFFSRYTG